MNQLVHSKAIKKDIKAAHKYIKEILEAPMAADGLKEELLKKFEYIKEKPYSRSFVQDLFLASLEIRSINVKNFTIFYRVKKNKDKKLKYENIVTVLRFMYSKRDWQNILKEDSTEGIK